MAQLDIGSCDAALPYILWTLNCCYVDTHRTRTRGLRNLRFHCHGDSNPNMRKFEQRQITKLRTHTLHTKSFVKTDQQIHTLFTIIYLYQCHPYMFRWSSHHRQGAPKVTGSVRHLKAYNITFKKQFSVPVWDLDTELLLKWNTVWL
jgi:hypothetical protein